MKKVIISLIFCLIFLLTLVSAQNQVILLNTRSPNTDFDYVLNYTTNVDCTGVLLNIVSSITTDHDGIGIINVPLDSLTVKPNYLCEYKDGSLRKVHNFSSQIFNTIWVDNIHSNNWSDVNITESQINDLRNYILSSDESNLDVNSADNWDGLDTYNSTQMQISTGNLEIKESWFTSLWNSIFGTKDTDDLTQGSTNLYYNQSLVNSSTVNGSIYFNGYTPSTLHTYYTGLNNLLYYPLSNPLNFFNSTTADALYCSLFGCTIDGVTIDDGEITFENNITISNGASGITYSEINGLYSCTNHDATDGEVKGIMTYWPEEYNWSYCKEL